MKICMYAFGGPSDNNRPVNYETLEVNSIGCLAEELRHFRDDNPGMDVVVCDARPSIGKAFKEAKIDGSFAAWTSFYNYVQSRGLC